MSAHKSKKVEKFRSHLEALETLPVNYELQTHEEHLVKLGWTIDKYCAELPYEPPGEPVPSGPFQLAKQIIHDYEFPDPRMITGIYFPEKPLPGRNMLLEAKFIGLKMYFGVRVGAVTDQIKMTDQGEVQIWGYHYHTLQGHFEMGQMHFEAWKWKKTGKVEFHICSYSKPDRIPNPVLRVGFKVAGRFLQKRFAETASHRLQQLVVERMAFRHEALASNI